MKGKRENAAYRLKPTARNAEVETAETDQSVGLSVNEFLGPFVLGRVSCRINNSRAELKCQMEVQRRGGEGFHYECAEEQS